MTAPASMAPQRYRFDDLTLDVGQRRLWRGEEAIRLSKLTFEVLRVLVEAAPNLVTYDELAERVWGPRRVVTAENISQRLMMLRQALGDHAGQPRYIEGMRGHGYRLIPAVASESSSATGDGKARTVAGPTTVGPQSTLEQTESELGSEPQTLGVPSAERDGAQQTLETMEPTQEASVTPRRDGTTASAAGRHRLIAGARSASPYLIGGILVLVLGWVLLHDNRVALLPNSVAVMPFSNLSANEEDSYFVLGMHDEVISQLVKLSGLNVISRTSMMQYADASKTLREVARELNVATVMEGSVRRAGDRVRVTVKLIDPRTASTLWSETYNGDMADVANIFAIQANIATNVASALEARLSLQEQFRISHVPTTSGEAYGYYLSAIAADHSSTPEGSERALRALERAVEIDENFALAWATLSYTLSVAPTWRPDRTAEYQDAALEAALKALELEPDLAEAHTALSFVSTVRGDWFRSEEEYRRAIEFGATRAEQPERGNFELAVGHIEQARTTFGSNRAVNPLNSSGLAFSLAANEIFGDRDAVRDGYQQGRTFMAAWPFGEYLMNYIRLGRGELDALADDTVAAPRFRAEFADFDSAKSALTALRSWYEALDSPNHNEHTLVAAWAAHHGDTELALAAATAATRTRVHNVWFLWLPLFDEVRHTSGFKELVVELDLVRYWQEYGWPTFCRPVGAEDFECS